MTTISFKQVLLNKGLSQSEAARRAEVSTTTINLLINKGHVPKSPDIRRRLSEVFDYDFIAIIKDSSSETEPEEEEVTPMLTIATIKHFKLMSDPFINDITDENDVYKTPAFHDIENAMRFSARSAGILCIVGESGSGKSVARDVVTANFLERDQVNVIYPRSFEKDKLMASAICQSIIDDIGDGKMKSGIEARARQVETLLCEMVRAGFHNVLIIEEAHDLNKETLKFLKRFWEMKLGFKRLIGVILIGQPELKSRLIESSNWSAREFIRRATTIELPPFSVNDIRAYLTLKFKKQNLDVSEILTDDAFPAIEHRLVVDVGGRLISNAYPLLINNIIRRALNEAAENAMSHVSADIINNL
jgi:type II secretory pathway predicted ATPase ExeA